MDAPAREERSNGSVDANRLSTGGVMTCEYGERIRSIVADRAEMALTRAVLSTAGGRFVDAGIMRVAVAEEVLAGSLLGWDTGIVLWFLVKCEIVMGGIGLLGRCDLVRKIVVTLVELYNLLE